MASAAPRLLATHQPLRRDAAFLAPGSRPAYRLLAIQALLVVAIAWRLRFGVDDREIGAASLLIGFVIALAMLTRRFALPAMAAALEASALIFTSSILVGCLSLVLATAGLPYRDDALAWADGWLMPFDAWPAMARALTNRPSLVAAMCRVYSTLLWQPFALIALLAATRREREIWRFVHAWCLALVASLAIFTLVPAIAAYRHYGIDPATIGGLSVNAGWHPAEVLAQIRSGAMHRIGSGGMTGLIAFPSFHAAGATMLAWGFRRVPIVGFAFVTLDVAMLLTVPLIGGHYFVDVLAGTAVAALSIHAASLQRA